MRIDNCLIVVSSNQFENSPEITNDYINLNSSNNKQNLLKFNNLISLKQQFLEDIPIIKNKKKIEFPIKNLLTYEDLNPNLIALSEKIGIGEIDKIFENFKINKYHPKFNLYYSRLQISDDFIFDISNLSYYFLNNSINFKDNNNYFPEKLIFHKKCDKNDVIEKIKELKNSSEVKREKNKKDDSNLKKTENLGKGISKNNNLKEKKNYSQKERNETKERLKNGKLEIKTNLEKKNLDKEKLNKENENKKEQEKKEQEKKEQEKKEQEKKEQEKKEQEKKKQEKKEQEKKEQEKKEQEKKEQEKKEQEKKEQEKKEQEKKEQEKKEQEKKEQEKKEQDKKEQEKKKQNKKDTGKIKENSKEQNTKISEEATNELRKINDKENKIKNQYSTLSKELKQMSYLSKTKIQNTNLNNKIKSDFKISKKLKRYNIFSIIPIKFTNKTKSKNFSPNKRIIQEKYQIINQLKNLGVKFEEKCSVFENGTSNYLKRGENFLIWYYFNSNFEFLPKFTFFVEFFLDRSFGFSLKNEIFLLILVEYFNEKIKSEYSNIFEVGNKFSIIASQKGKIEFFFEGFNEKNFITFISKVLKSFFSKSQQNLNKIFYENAFNKIDSSLNFENLHVNEKVMQLFKKIYQNPFFTNIELKKELNLVNFEEFEEFYSNRNLQIFFLKCFFSGNILPGQTDEILNDFLGENEIISFDNNEKFAFEILDNDKNLTFLIENSDLFRKKNVILFCLPLKFEENFVENIVFTQTIFEFSFKKFLDKNLEFKKNIEKVYLKNEVIAGENSKNSGLVLIIETKEKAKISYKCLKIFLEQFFNYFKENLNSILKKFKISQENFMENSSLFQNSFQLWNFLKKAENFEEVEFLFNRNFEKFNKEKLLFANKFFENNINFISLTIKNEENKEGTKEICLFNDKFFKDEKKLIETCFDDQKKIFSDDFKEINGYKRKKLFFNNFLSFQ